MMPQPSPEACSQLLKLLRESIREAQQLNAALETERSALQQQDTDLISKALLKKTGAVETLQALEKARDELVTGCGYASGPEQMPAFIDGCTDGHAIGDCWNELMKIAAAGRDMNLSNGAIIRARQKHFENSLMVLRGVTPGTDTYGRGGTEAGDYHRRSLAEA